MPTKPSIPHPLIILLIIGLCLGVYKAAVLGCISTDSVTFLEFADRLQTEPAVIIKSHYQHPGYPAAVLAAEKAMAAIIGPLSVSQKVFAGQLVNLSSRLLATIFLFYAFLHFGSRKTAFFNTLLVILIPTYAENGSDVLSDWSNLMLMAVAFFCCLKGLRDTHPAWFLATGIASGLAYWIRPEGLFVSFVAGVYIVIHLFYSSHKLKWLTCLAVMLISAGLLTAPYMIHKGALFPKKKVGTFSQRSGRETDNALQVRHDNLNRAEIHSASVMVYGEALLYFFERSFNTVYLLLIPLCIAMAYRLRRFRRLMRQERFLLLFIALWLLMMLWLYGRTGYMSRRHIMPLLVFSFAWLYQGLLLSALLLWKNRQMLRRNTLILLVICVSVFIPKLISPDRMDKIAYKQAGLWLAKNTPETATIAVFDKRIGYYSQRPYRRIRPQRPVGDYLVVPEPSDQVVIPTDAVRLTTHQSGIDESIAIYALRDHQE